MMRGLEQELRGTEDPRDLERADIIACMLKARGSDIALLSSATPAETKSLPQEFRPFTDKEITVLVEDGAIILNLTGETIEGQRTAGRLFRDITDGGDRLLKAPSIIAQVAIYPDPERFFIPNTGGKDLATQEKLAQKDGQELRKRLGLKDDSLDVIIPEQASTFTELTFKYLDKTTKEGKGIWLFGPDYGYRYGRTKNPVNESGSSVADVGDADPDGGVNVDRWYRAGGNDNLHVVRLIVFIRTKEKGRGCHLEI